MSKNKKLFPLTPENSVAIIALCIFLGVYLFQNAHIFLNTCPGKGDYALIATDAELVKNELLLSGTYSRLGFRHPGPIYSYFFAASEYLFPFFQHPEGSHFLFLFLLNALLLTIALFTLQHFLGGLSAPIFLLASLFTLLRVRKDFLLSPWNPATEVIPMLTFLIAAAAIIRAGPTLFPLFCLCAVLIVHNHLSGLVLVPAIFLIVSIVLFRKYQNKEKEFPISSPAFVGGIIILCTGILPILFDFLINQSTSNPARTLSYLNGEGQQRDFAQGIRYISGFYHSHFRHILPDISVYVIPAITWIGLLLIAFSKKEFLRILARILLVSVVLSIIGSTRIDNPRYQYPYWWHYSVVALSFSLCIFSVTQIFWEKVLSAISSQKQLYLAGASSLILFTVIGFSTKHLYTLPPKQCGKFYSSLIEHINPSTEKQYEIRIRDHNQWSTAAGLTLRLLRSGYPFCVERKWHYLFRKSLLCDSENNSRILIEFFNPERFEQLNNRENLFQRKKTLVRIHSK